MNIIECEQRSPEWYAAKLGRVSASRIADLMATIKSGESASRRNYRADIIVERMTGTSPDFYINAAMQWGIDNEAAARECYEFLTGNTVREVGFILHPTIDGAGCSPDGLIGDVGMVEIKCPNTATHIDTLLAKKADPKYFQQMQFQLACSGCQWVDFVTYDPRMADHLQIRIYRVGRDEPVISAINAEVIKFLAEVETTIVDLGNV